MCLGDGLQSGGNAAQYSTLSARALVLGRINVSGWSQVAFAMLITLFSFAGIMVDLFVRAP
jgi:hypothetical protein